MRIFTRINGSGIITIILLAILLITPAEAMKNPAAVYCGALGHSYVVEKTPSGGDFGYCILPGNEKADAWKFISGTTGAQYSYCARIGFRQEQSFDPTECVFTNPCLVCISPSGTRSEMLTFMNLSFSETTCGDGRCGIFEDTGSCRADCLSGDWDHLCDGIRDGRCDPDCTDDAGDPDCMAAPYYWIILGITVLVIISIGGILFMKKKKGAGNQKGSS